jgi:hypothetical protein
MPKNRAKTMTARIWFLRRRLDDVARDHLQEEVGAADALGRALDDARRAARPFGQQPLGDERVDAFAWAQQVDEQQADADGDGRNRDGEHQRLQSGSPEGGHVAHLGHPDHQGGEQQGQHQHEQQAQEDLPDGARDVAGHRLDPGRVRSGRVVDDQPAHQTGDEADQHPGV